MTKIEESEYLLERSKRFFESAVMQVERGFYDLAAFSLEQSLQLYLKAYLLKMGVDYPRTHSVRRLLELMYEVSGHEGLRDLLIKYAVELGSLEDAYITSRYIARTYSREEIERLKRAVEEIKDAVRRLTS